MPTITDSTQRTTLGDLVKGYDNYGDEVFSDHQISAETVVLSGSTAPIGTILKYNGTKFAPIAETTDWAADTVTAVGDVVVPTTNNGYEYVCTAIATDGKTHGTTEPTWPTTIGVTVVDDAVTWTCRLPFIDRGNSSLPNKDLICISVGNGRGIGCDDGDMAAVASTTMTVLYRGPATIIDDYVEWGTIPAADQAEIKSAFERRGIHFEDKATAVTPNYIS